MSITVLQIACTITQFALCMQDQAKAKHLNLKWAQTDVNSSSKFGCTPVQLEQTSFKN